MRQNKTAHRGQRARGSILGFTETRVQEFLSEIKPWIDVYNRSSFCYAAVEFDGNFNIAQARLYLSPEENAGYPHTHFRHGRVRAGQYRLSELGLGIEGLIGALIGGTLETPDGPLKLRGNESGRIGAIFKPFHEEGLAGQSRLSVLTLLGGRSVVPANQPMLDWELRAADTPYDSFQELMSEYRVGLLRDDVCTVEVAALSIMAVDLSCIVQASGTEIALRMYSGLDREKVKLGYRISGKEKITRGSIKGNELEWSEVSGTITRGVARLDAPAAALVQCFASYSGVTQNYGWVTDPMASANANRAVYEVFDDKLEVLQKFLSKQGRGNSRDLETGVAWLLWLLGFKAAHLGATATTQDAADIVATSPYGHFVVIECTTGVLKADHKLSILIDRAEAIKTRLSSSNNSHLRVLPVILTSKSRMEVRTDLEQAERLGILVITRENIQEALRRTAIQQDADKLFAEAEEAVKVALAKYEQKPPYGDTNNG